MPWASKIVVKASWYTACGGVSETVKVASNARPELVTLSTPRLIEGFEALGDCKQLNQQLLGGFNLRHSDGDNQV